MSGDLAEVKALLQARIESLARTLAPEGHRNGRYWMAKNPTRADRHAGSFVIWLQGHAPGGWKDYAGDCEKGGRDTGDVIGLVAYVQFGDKTKTREALAWARDWLGIARMSTSDRARIVARQRQAVAVSAQAAAREQADNRRRAKGVYLAARKRPWAGSPAERYLQRRGIDFAAVGRMPGALGWLPEEWHVESQRKWPCLVAAMTGPDGTVWAVHRTFLAADGAAKAPVEPQRKIWPAGWQGAAIRLWRGDSGLDIKEAAGAGLCERLVLGEGIETVGSVVMASPQHRAWCTGTLGNLAHIDLPACCDEVTVLVDNDWGKPQAARALDAGIGRLAAQGRQVLTARSHVGKDFNDALRST